MFNIDRVNLEKQSALEQQLEYEGEPESTTIKGGVRWDDPTAIGCDVSTAIGCDVSTAIGCDVSTAIGCDVSTARHDITG